MERDRVTGDDSFDVWERRDLATSWDPWSSWSRAMLPMIEAGAMFLGGRWEREQ